MPSGPELQILPPKDWVSFESLCHSLWKRKWKDPEASKNGRSGQPQSGVDIYGRFEGTGGYYGVQCKGKDGNLNSYLTKQDLIAEVEKAKSFVPKLKSFIVATTAANDTSIMEEARKISDANEANGLFSVSVRGWDDIINDLYDHPEVIDKHYPEQSSAIRQVAEDTQTIIDGAKANQEQTTVHLSDIKSMLTNGADAHWDGKLDKQINEEIDKYVALINAGKPQTALDLLKQLEVSDNYKTAKDSTKFRLQTNYGASYVALGDYEEAAKFFKKAHALEPSSEKAKYNYTYAHILTGDIKKAQSLADECLKEFPASSIAASFVLYSRVKSSVQEVPENLVSQELLEQPQVLHALNVYYRERKDFSKQAQYAEKLYELEPKNLQAKQSYAEALIAPIFSEAGLTLYKLSLPEIKRDLLKAESLFQEAFDEIIKSENKFSLFPVAINLASVKKALRKYTEAEKNLRDAILYANQQTDIDDLEEQLLQLALTTENAALGKAAIKNIKRDFKEKEFFLALLEMLDNNFSKAINDFENIIKSKPSRDIKTDSLMNLVLAIQKTQGDKKAVDYLRKKAKQFKSESSFFSLQAHLYNRLNDRKNRDTAINKAITLLTHESSLYEIIEVADRLISFKRFSEAADLYARIITSPTDHALYDKYLLTLLNSDRRADLKNELKKISTELLDKPFVRKIHAIYNTIIGDLPAAKESFEAYINKYGANDPDIYLHYAQTLMRLTEDGLVTEFLKTEFPKEISSTIQKINYYQMLALSGETEKALKYARDVYYQNYDDANAHLGYMGVFYIIDTQSKFLPIFHPDTVSLDTEFTVELHPGEQKSFTIEDDSKLGLDDNVLPSDHFIAKAASGKKVGEKIVLYKSDVKKDEGTIVSIRNKFVADYQEIINKFNFLFPENQKMISFHLDEGKTPEENFKPILKMLDKNYESTTKLIEDYRANPISIGLLAHMAGSNAFKAYKMVRSIPVTGCFSCVGTQEERQKAYEQALDNKGYIIDPLSLYIIHDLNLEDLVLVSAQNDLAVTQTTIECFYKYLEELKKPTNGYMAKTENGYVWQESLPQERQAQADSIENYIKWIKKNCKIVPAVEANQPPEILQEILLKTDPASLDVLIAANGSSRTFICEDLRLRQYGEELYKIPAVWLQPLLHTAARNKFISASEYHDATIKLLEANHNYTSLEAACLHHHFVSANRSLSPALENAFRYLESKNTERQGCFNVCAVFLIWAWRMDIDIGLKEKITYLVLRTLFYQRWGVFNNDIQLLIEILKDLDSDLYGAFLRAVRKWCVGHMIPSKK